MSAELSPMVARLVELLGKRTALALCRAGGAVYVPSRMNSKCRLARMIGPAATAKLMQFYAGQQITLPKLAARDRAARDAEIRAMAAAGATGAQIAMKHSLSTRQVRNILRA